MLLEFALYAFGYTLPFSVKVYPHRHWNFAPFRCWKLRYDSAFPTNPLHSQSAWRIALNICMPVLFSCESVKSLTHCRNKEVMGPVLRQLWCQCYSQLLRNLKWKATVIHSKDLHNEYMVVISVQYICQITALNTNSVWETELCLLYSWEAQPVKIRLT